MFSKIVLLATLSTVSLGVQFHMLNREQGDIWVGVQGNSGHEHLQGGGFVLKPGQSISIQAADNWAGRFWGRTWCESNSNHCATGDCGNKLQCNGAGGAPPVSLAEITLKGSGGLDYYDVSLVDGFNIEIAIEPLGGKGDGGQYSCKKSACQVRVNDQCPEKLQVRNSQSAIIACNSACNAFNTDEYCCRGAFATSDTCKASTWPKNYPDYFKKRCPDAYSYAYDDHKSTFTCGAKEYLVTFGG